MNDMRVAEARMQQTAIGLVYLRNSACKIRHIERSRNAVKHGNANQE